MSSEKQMKRLRKAVYGNSCQRDTKYAYEGQVIMSIGNRRKYQSMKKLFRSLAKSEKNLFIKNL